MARPSKLTYDRGTLILHPPPRGKAWIELATWDDRIEVGLLGGGARDRSPILIATYNSAAIHAEALGNRYAMLVFDECHHLPTDFFRVIAEYSIAPYRLGLTATPERTDGNPKRFRYVNWGSGLPQRSERPCRWDFSAT